MQTIILSTETTESIKNAIAASVSADKAASKSNEKTRDALNHVYSQVSDNNPMTVDYYKQARTVILEECKKAKSWPISEKTDEKAGYQAAMKQGCSAAIWYNKAQALLQLDLKTFLKSQQEQQELQHILDTDPDALKDAKQQQTEKAKNEKIASAFHNFVKLFEDLSQADKTFQELLKVAKAAKTK